MIDPEQYYTFLDMLKTYVNHHGRNLVFLSNGDPIPFVPVDEDFEETGTPQLPSNDSKTTDEANINSAQITATDKLNEDSNGKEYRNFNSEVVENAVDPGPPPSYLDDSPPLDDDYYRSESDDDVIVGFANDEADTPDDAHPSVSDLDMDNMTMEKLYSIWKECLNCPLGPTRKNMVFGEGSVPASLMFIGEGPGANEDRLGRPFVGKAGTLLDKMIKAMGFSREDIYIGNIVKCRPPGNRDPHPDEMIACMPVLLRQIELIQPKVIVALGRIASQALLSSSLSLGKLRGKWHTFKGIDLMPTYHPAYLLRNESSKKKAWDDLQMVIKKLNSKENNQ